MSRHSGAGFAEVDVRVVTHKQAREIGQAIRELGAPTAGTSLPVEGGSVGFRWSERRPHATYGAGPAAPAICWGWT